MSLTALLSFLLIHIFYSHLRHIRKEERPLHAIPCMQLLFFLSELLFQGFYYKIHSLQISCFQAFRFREYHLKAQLRL